MPMTRTRARGGCVSRLVDVCRRKWKNQRFASGLQQIIAPAGALPSAEANMHLAIEDSVIDVTIGAIKDIDRRIGPSTPSTRVNEA